MLPLDECRRRVQLDLFGTRGRAGDPLYRIKRLLTMANERTSDKAKDRLVGLLHAGDPHGEVRTTWEAKEALRDLYTHRDQDLATKYFDELMVVFICEEHPPEVHLLGKTLRSWRSEILAWHTSGVTNGPTESMNNLIKRIKRIFVYRPSWCGSARVARNTLDLLTGGSRGHLGGADESRPNSPWLQH
ncbi:MAG: ISL3 family transposase [Ferrimicrobium sp.]